MLRQREEDLHVALALRPLVALAVGAEPWRELDLQPGALLPRQRARLRRARARGWPHGRLAAGGWCRARGARAGRPWLGLALATAWP